MNNKEFDFLSGWDQNLSGVPLLRRALDIIEADGTHFHMGSWCCVEYVEGDRFVRYAARELEEVKNKLCRTTFCLAGLICWIKGDEFFKSALMTGGWESDAIDEVHANAFRDVATKLSTLFHSYRLPRDEVVFIGRAIADELEAKLAERQRNSLSEIVQ
ncbi:hypothetical protein ACQ4M3_09605 [Leptolyngbya sp. AN03gr2]|uniref:hypothetical protein n=1 Tax=Leptolyngbya sp. AN03gr2 TaxID=3423364 RepID=UPI003D30FD51